MKRKLLQGMAAGLIAVAMMFFGLWFGGKIGYWHGWEKGYAEGVATHPVVKEVPAKTCTLTCEDLLAPPPKPKQQSNLAAWKTHHRSVFIESEYKHIIKGMKLKGHCLFWKTLLAYNLLTGDGEGPCVILGPTDYAYGEESPDDFTTRPVVCKQNVVCDQKTDPAYDLVRAAIAEAEKP